MTVDNNDTSLRGVLAAALTPLTAALEPDLDCLVAHGKTLLAHGCDGLAVLGTTGEANTLSIEQRLGVIEAACAGLPGDRLVIGTGCCALTDTLTLTRAALAAGCDNVLMLPPFYYKNPSDDGVFRAFAEVIERVGSARLRIYLYHFPQMSAVPIPVAVIARLLDAYPGTVVGVKDSSGDWDHTAMLLREFPHLASFAGTERLLLDNLRAGGPGCISATANVTALMAHAVYRAWQGNEPADDLQRHLTAARRALEGFPAIAALKYLTGSGDSRWRHILPPLVPLSGEQQRALRAAVDGIDAYDPVPQIHADMR